jgi:hypothetical protein
MRFVLPAILLAAVLLPATAKDPLPAPATSWNPRCSAAEASQLDFWIGEWDLRVRQRITADADEYREGRATESVRPILDGCAILEEFEGDKLPRPLVGMSVSTFDEKSAKWQQTWVDNGAHNITFAGGYVDGRIELLNEQTVEGEKVLWRITFRNIRNDGFDWDYDRSRDGGRTWRNLWQIHYSRSTSGPII